MQNLKKMTVSKNISKIIFIIGLGVVFYSQIILWQNYLLEKTGKPPELNFMDAEYHIQRGIQYQSEDELRKAVKLDPINPGIRIKLASYYFSAPGAGNQDKARKEYEKALLYSSEKQQLKIFEDVYANITQDLVFLKSVVPDTGLAMHSFAAFLCDKKFYEQAASEYKFLIKTTSDSYTLSDSYNWLGIMCLWSAKYDEAIGYFNSAISTVKDDKYKSWILRNLGYAYLNKNDFQKTVEIYKVAIKTDPACWASYYIMGSAYEKMGLKKEAGEYYYKSLQHNPGSYKQKILESIRNLRR